MHVSGESALSVGTVARTALVVGAAIVGFAPGVRAQAPVPSWLDTPAPTGWNVAGADVPAAPKMPAADARCRDGARPAQVDADRRVRARGWHLVGAFQGGWQVVVVRGAAGYDGMCRPLGYQDFVFVDGTFAGTLSPTPMDSRTDGALAGVSLQSRARLTAEYVRYASSDALCCPSRISRVVFEIPPSAPVRPVSSETQAADAASAQRPAPRALQGTYWKASEIAGTAVVAQDRSREAHLQFDAGRVSGSDGCNRIMGGYDLAGERLSFGRMAGTLMACAEPVATEALMRDALERTARVHIAGDRLELFDATGARLAVFVAADAPSSSARASSASGAATPGLAGTSWQLVGFTGSDGTTMTPDDRAKYTIAFEADGRLAARVDCNRGRGTWKVSGTNGLALGPLALTRAMCPPGSLHDRIVSRWEHVRSFALRDGHLFLSLMADGGVFEYAPASAQPR